MLHLGAVIVETAVFTRRVAELLSDDEYRKLQVILANRPTAGSLIAGSGGLRKLRWASAGTGKRGGVRVIYYWAPKQHRLLMLLIYAKNVRDGLASDQLKTLRSVVAKEFS
jgi:hypothetical protein